MKTIDLSLIKNLPKREAKYIRVLRYLDHPATLRELYLGQSKTFANNDKEITHILKDQGFIRHEDWTGTERIKLSEAQHQANYEYTIAYYTLLIYYPETSWSEGNFTQMPSRHFTGALPKPKNLPVTRTKVNGVYLYTLKT